MPAEKDMYKPVTSGRAVKKLYCKCQKRRGRLKAETLHVPPVPELKLLQFSSSGNGFFAQCSRLLLELCRNKYWQSTI